MTTLTGIWLPFFAVVLVGYLVTWAWWWSMEKRGEV